MKHYTKIYYTPDTPTTFAYRLRVAMQKRYSQRKVDKLYGLYRYVSSSGGLQWLPVEIEDIRLSLPLYSGASERLIRAHLKVLRHARIVFQTLGERHFQDQLNDIFESVAKNAGKQLRQSLEDDKSSDITGFPSDHKDTP